MKYKNPYYKKTKRAFDMVLSCNFCKKDLGLYKKVGKGGLLRIWLSRLVETEFPIDINKNSLLCPFCSQELARLVKLDGSFAYKPTRSSIQTRRKD